MSEKMVSDCKTKKGEPLTITISQTSGTGYIWFLSSLPDIVWLEDIQYVPRHPSVPGSPVDKKFIFMAMKSGTGEITFSLTRPWSIQPITQTRTYIVEITE